MQARVVWDDDVDSPPASETLMRTFESENGVVLPPLFRSIYRMHNGGRLLNSDDLDMHELLPIAENLDECDGLCLRSLASWVAEGAFFDLDDLSAIEQEVGDAALVFPLWTDGGRCHALNYNLNGRDHEPGVIYFDADGGEFVPVADTFQAWVMGIVAPQKTEEAASVVAFDWSEVQRLSLIARESIATDRSTAQALAEDAAALYYFRAVNRAGESEVREKGMLPKPLDLRSAPISSRSFHDRTLYNLTLRPSDTQVVEWKRSRCLGENGWTLVVSQGDPNELFYESTTLGELHRIRKHLLGASRHYHILNEERKMS